MPIHKLAIKRRKIDATFKKVDKNSDGFISREEVREALLEHNLSDMEVENVLAKVGLEDAVNFNKLSELITPYWDNVVPTRDHVEAVFKLEASGDFIAAPEFLAVANILGYEDLQIEQVHILINKVDSDKDGRINFNEFYKLLEKKDKT